MNDPVNDLDEEDAEETVYIEGLLQIVKKILLDYLQSPPAITVKDSYQKRWEMVRETFDKMVSTLDKNEGDQFAQETRQEFAKSRLKILYQVFQKSENYYALKGLMPSPDFDEWVVELLDCLDQKKVAPPSLHKKMVVIAGTTPRKNLSIIHAGAKKGEDYEKMVAFCIEQSDASNEVKEQAKELLKQNLGKKEKRDQP